MKTKFLYYLSVLGFALSATDAIAVPTHALTLYGEPKYKADFDHVDYVRVDAPKGGTIKQYEMGSFDSLNAFIIKGVKAPGINMIYESLMTPSLDEPQSMYPRIARSVEVAADKRSVTFTLNKNARWHDGKNITAEDVIFSFYTLKEKGDPTFALSYKPIDKVTAEDNTVTFHFVDGEIRELPFIVASMPILPKHYYATHDFEKTTLEAPLGSGPYKIGSVDAGRSITYERVKNWWGADLPINKGQYNFDVIRYDMYRDENVSLEAFKAGEYDFRREYIARNWANGYQSPALEKGKFIKREMMHNIPQGMQAFVFNLRKEKFADRRVREAVNLAMDFEWLNKTLFYNAYLRNTSFFGSTPFAADTLPDTREKALLDPFADLLAPDIFTKIPMQPVGDGSGQSRTNLLKAQELLNAAGYVVKEGKRIDPATGKPMEIEFLLRQPSLERVIGAMRKNLERLGISSSIRRVDDAQYQQRLNGFDFDMVSVWLNNGVFFPGNEQMLYWHSSQAMVKGANNIVGLQHKAVDALLEKLVAAKNLEELTPPAKALDRVLLTENVVVPHWHSQSFRIAYWDKFGLPKTPPLYDIGLNTWWMKE
jgi:microcin C transport system substrate-binding protein